MSPQIYILFEKILPEIFLQQQIRHKFPFVSDVCSSNHDSFMLFSSKGLYLSDTKPYKILPAGKVLCADLCRAAHQVKFLWQRMNSSGSCP